MPSLEWLRQRGSAYRLDVPGPGYGAPAAATLLTGALPVHHGVALDTLPGPLRADSLPAAARRVNLSTVAVGDALWGALVAEQVQGFQTAAGPGALLERARPLLAPTGPRFLILQTGFLHREGHRLRSTSPQNPEYRELLAELDAHLVQLLGAVDLKTTAIAVVSSVPVDGQGDHTAGRKAPLILAGAGIRTGLRGEGSLLDVAPTLAALLGAPTPLQHSGRVLTEALTVEGRPLDAIAQRQMAVRKGFADSLLQGAGQVALTPDPPGTLAEGDVYLAGIGQQVRAARFQAWKAGLTRRLPYFGPALLLLALYLVIAVRQPFGGPLMMGALTYGLVFHLLFFGTGGRYSPFIQGLEGLPRAAVAGLGLRAAVAMSAGAIVTGLFLSRRTFKRTSYLTSAALHMILSTLVLISLPVVAAVGITGWEFPAELPHLSLLVWFFVTGVQVAVVGYMSPLWAVLTLTVVRLARNLWPLKEVGDPERNADKVVRMRSLRRSVRR